MSNIKFIKIGFLIVLGVNLLCFMRYYRDEEKVMKNMIKSHSESDDLVFDDEVKIPQGKAYEEMDTEEKVAFLLRMVKEDPQRFWLANVNVTSPGMDLPVKDFLRPAEGEVNYANTPELFYDPRFTLAVYLDEIKTQFREKNPTNARKKIDTVTVPFAWSDWVDLTMLNEELSQPIEKRHDCEYLRSNMNKPTKYPDFCKSILEVNDDDLKEMGVPSKEYIPGFAIVKSPMNKSPHDIVMMQGKSHLLLYQENPISIIFLTDKGTYEVEVSKKERIVQGNLLLNYLKRRDIDPDSRENLPQTVHFDPIEEFEKLQSTVSPRPLDIYDDIHGVFTKNMLDTNTNLEVVLDPEDFYYNDDCVESQIHDYENKLNQLNDMFTNELHYDIHEVEKLALTRHEVNHYEGLKYSRPIAIDDEPTYYKLATLKKTKEFRDAGWHYEWRFFNGALRYLKPGWTENQLEQREQIILDRLLRNWFRFAKEKGLISWIAHGPLLAWYWDGLMFPFDLDIDLQMPVSELNRLAKNYNMTLVVEDITEGLGKYLIDCSSFIHHRDKAKLDNVIDARFIDVDTGTYIDITGLAKNNERIPPEYDGYVREEERNGRAPQVYMDRRKHWLSLERLSPLRYSMMGGVPILIPNNIMVMLNHEYEKGTRSYYFSPSPGVVYYYVPKLRLWIEQANLLGLFDKYQFTENGEVNPEKLFKLVRDMTDEDKVKLLEKNDEILVEYYKTHRLTRMHEAEKKYLFDASLQQSVTDLNNSTSYQRLVSKFHMAKPLRKPLFDYEYIERLQHT